MFWLEFALMTAFNASICILLPRLVTLDWGKLIKNRLKQETRKETSSQNNRVDFTGRRVAAQKANR